MASATPASIEDGPLDPEIEIDWDEEFIPGKGKQWTHKQSKQTTFLNPTLGKLPPSWSTKLDGSRIIIQQKLSQFSPAYNYDPRDQPLNWGTYGNGYIYHSTRAWTAWSFGISDIDAAHVLGAIATDVEFLVNKASGIVTLRRVLGPNIQPPEGPGHFKNVFERILEAAETLKRIADEVLTTVLNEGKLKRGSKENIGDQLLNDIRKFVQFVNSTIDIRIAQAAADMMAGWQSIAGLEELFAGMKKWVEEFRKLEIPGTRRV